MKNKKKLLLTLSLLTITLVLTGCGTSEITSSSTGIWDHYIVYNFGRAIKALSFSASAGLGIILFTLIVRVILFPLMNYQMKSMRKTQELQPKIKVLQEKYAAKDPETRRKLQEETQRLYSEHGVNPFAGCLPLLIQMPILMALYQAISRVDGLKTGSFLWMKLAEPDPYIILPILAALFTFLSTKLSSMSQVESNPAMTAMTYFMPVMIFFMALNFPSALSLYWVVGNAFQVIQTLMINNPFKIRKEREEEAKRKRDLERAVAKAHKSKKKRNKK
ncbi:membrane protein insertase YidC [Vagococcus coleopterorum]|uniref:Membrane protein insertase YidC n=1 Tax=Vagococcus coleopterorum TaxID=2714946 RepID=A0A6G8ALR4_9ENTE|nr:YidC/Oxa1 family membrane protein insertase [Vagococcus coleopterorum]QIL45998.1 membrane protein insertase YidC [Vagococcus coleopterorum]